MERFIQLTYATSGLQFHLAVPHIVTIRQRAAAEARNNVGAVIHVANDPEPLLVTETYVDVMKAINRSRP